MMGQFPRLARQSDPGQACAIAAPAAAVFSSLAVVVMLCICILWAGYQLNMFISGGAAGWLLALQVRHPGHHGGRAGRTGRSTGRGPRASSTSTASRR